jgi:hypothetical protein
MSWRIAESLETLRRQLNAAFPNRSKASDGGIGDAAHASRSSDHNPYIKDSKGVGVVTARDFTHDPAGGLDCHWLARQLVKERDPRIKYIIWNKQICSSKQQPWKWRPYNGINAHRHHLHLSVDADPKLYDSTAPWDLDIAQTHNPVAGLTDEEIDSALDEKFKVSTVEQSIPSVPLPQTAAFTETVQPSNPSIAEVQTTVNSEGQTEIEKTQQVAQGFTAKAFQAYIPQIDTAKRYLKTLSGMTGLGAVAAFFAGLPPWVIIALFVLLAIVIIGGIVIIVKYHEKIFSYITAMNTLRATEGTHNPIVTSEKPE